MRIWQRIRDAVRGPELPAAPSRQAPAPSRSSSVEHVPPDGRLVSSRAPVPVYALDAQAPLPDNRTWYASPAAPHLRFAFTFVRTPNGDCRAYIREQPSYRGRTADAVTSHRLSDHRGHYVCWSPMPRDPVAMLKVTRLWADRTIRYVTTGVRLEAP